MHSLKYILYREGDYYASQCLNVEVSSFGSTVQEAIDNLKEAVELYFEDNDEINTFTQKRKYRWVRLVQLSGNRA